MKHPLRTLLYGLFVAPVLRVLQAIIDWFGKAVSVVKADAARSHRRRLGMDQQKSVGARDTRNRWEKMGVVAPVYALAGQGLSNRAIAVKLNLTETTVYDCISYLLERLKCRTRAELVLYASPASESWNLRNSLTMMISGIRRWRQRKLAKSL